MAFETELDPEIPLPPLQVATLDEATLGQLFFDVAHAAELLGVTFKGGATAHAHESADPRRALETARRLFAGGEGIGVQLRYRFQGATWLDTLMRAPGGVRLVRVRQDDMLAAG
jgi:hypothetical protein